MTYLHKLFIFTRERFDPLPYSLMIFVFWVAHYSMYLYFERQPLEGLNFQAAIYLFPMALATFIFFFKLRLFDEVKDLESDIVNHPDRPLPRGLLKESDVFRLVYIAIATEFVLFSLYGLWAALSSALAIGYSLLMYKEFFFRRWLRSHLTVYAITHTFVVVFISIAIFTSLLKKPFIELPLNFIYFSIAGWFIFNIFEFGRKTFTSREERNGVDSYSKTFGRYGAVSLVLITATLGMMFLSKALTLPLDGYLFFWSALLIASGLFYALFDTANLAKIYRAATSIYLILIYGTVMCSYIYTLLL